MSTSLHCLFVLKYRYPTFSLFIHYQIANVGPMIYVPLTKFFQAKTNGFCSRCLQPPERIANYLILAVGLISCILISQFWNVSTVMFARFRYILSFDYQENCRSLLNYALENVDKHAWSCYCLTEETFLHTNWYVIENHLDQNNMTLTCLNLLRFWFYYRYSPFLLRTI